MTLVFLPNRIPIFQPTEAQIALLAKRIGGDVRSCLDEAEFLRLLPSATAAIVWRFEQAWFEHAPNLRHIFTPAAGRDYFRIVPPQGVELHYGDFHGAIMAETALGAIISCSHGLYAELMRDSEWPRLETVPLSRRLHGATVAILGYGNIGRALGALLKPFGAKVVGMRRRADPASGTIGPEGLDDLLRVADHVVCFLPSGPETTNLLDARRIALMKKSAFLYNFGRGNLIDEDALAYALNAGRLAGAVLDVFKEEPLPASSPLRTARNCRLYPHSSAFSPDYLDLYFDSLPPGFN